MTYDMHAQAKQVTEDIAARSGNGGEPEESQAETIANGGRPALESSRVDVPEGQGRTAEFQQGFANAHPAGSTTPDAGFTGPARPLAPLPGDDND